MLESGGIEIHRYCCATHSVIGLITIIKASLQDRALDRDPERNWVSDR